MLKLVREVRLAVVGFDSTPCLPDVLKSVREVRSATVRIGSIPWMQDDIESVREVCLAAVNLLARDVRCHVFRQVVSAPSHSYQQVMFAAAECVQPSLR